MRVDPALNREILLSFWKVHILHHAAREPIVGQWMLNELRRHGYDVSPGTMYPLLQRMTAHGWLRCEIDARGGAHARRFYTLTDAGRAVLRQIHVQLTELYREVNAADDTVHVPEDQEQ